VSATQTIFDVSSTLSGYGTGSTASISYSFHVDKPARATVTAIFGNYDRSYGRAYLLSGQSTLIDLESSNGGGSSTIALDPGDYDIDVRYGQDVSPNDAGSWTLHLAVDVSEPQPVVATSRLTLAWLALGMLAVGLGRSRAFSGAQPRA
jgi:hypothetical protein